MNVLERIITTDGHSLAWVTEIRYIGPHIVAGRQLRCSVTHTKRFRRSINTIVEKVRRLPCEEVTIRLVKSECLSILLYGLEC